MQPDNEINEINVIALVKDSERYVWLYPDCERLAVLRAFGRAAANPELSLTWYDAMVLSQKVRQDNSEIQEKRRIERWQRP